MLPVFPNSNVEKDHLTICKDNYRELEDFFRDLGMMVYAATYISGDVVAMEYEDCGVFPIQLFNKDDFMIINSDFNETVCGYCDCANEIKALQDELSDRAIRRELSILNYFEFLIKKHAGIIECDCKPDVVEAVERIYNEAWKEIHAMHDADPEMNKVIYTESENNEYC